MYFAAEFVLRVHATGCLQTGSFLQALRLSNTQHVVLCGDFNLPGRQMDLLSDLLLDRSLIQLVKQPTRGENILDLLLTNSPDMISQVDVASGIPGSDHDAIQFLARFVKYTPS